MRQTKRKQIKVLSVQGIYAQEKEKYGAIWGCVKSFTH
jgi:hypothetical protein